MKIEWINELTAVQKLAARTLIRQVLSYDGTFREPYLSNQLNFDVTMPAFFMAYEGKELVGLLTVYADDEKAEICLLVAPEWRRQGIARKLFETFIRETADFALEEICLVTERRFLEANPTLLEHWNGKLEDYSEYWLGRDRTPFDLEHREDLLVTKAGQEHVETIARFQAQTFDNPIEQSRRYAQKAVEDEESLLYLVVKAGKVLASCTVDHSSDSNYLFGLAVAEGYRGQGIGTYLVKSLINDRILQDTRPFQIVVEADNPQARRLYERLGFAEQREVLSVKVSS